MHHQAIVPLGTKCVRDIYQRT